MPQFLPFAGVRYRTADGRLDDLIAPPYDVISPDDRASLVRKSEHNAVRLELPVEEDGADRYAAAATLWGQWLAAGVLAPEETPAFYAYRMDFRDEAGRPRYTEGVLGALQLEPPGTGILPHERTTAKDKADRLNLLRACRANLSPIWGLSPAAGLTELIRSSSPPDAAATDEDGVEHRLWLVTDPAVQQAITAAVATQPVIVADGHHRYEVGLAYQAEATGTPGAGAILALVVELADEQLSVRAIHRLIDGLPAGFDIVAALEPFFAVTATDPIDESIISRMDEAGALALHTEAGTWLLTPKAGTSAEAEHDLDSSRLDVALAALPTHDLTFQHGWDRVAAAVDKGEAQAAVLLRPATVDQIKAIGHGGERMPPKTTFFYPKPRTGLVFRSLDSVTP